MPWQTVTGPEPTPSGPSLTRGRRGSPLPSPLDAFDALYREFASNLGWTPRQVDTLEVWEAARLLGVPDDRPAIPAARLVTYEGDGDGGKPSSTLVAQMHAARLAAARGQQPPPDWTS